MEDSVPIRARKALDHYLEENKLRKTPERYAILDAIYHIKGAFALEDLSKSLIEQNFRVSRATLYNTIRFFLKIRLVMRHRFMNGTRYTASLAKPNLCHQVCTVCGRVTDVQIPAVSRAIGDAKYRRFHQDTYTLYIYGVCSNCQAKQTRRKQQSNKIEFRKTKIQNGNKG